MNNNNVYDLLVAVGFAMSFYICDIWPKSQDLVAPFKILKSESLPDFYMYDIQSRSNICLLSYNIYQKNFLTHKYIIKLSKIKHLQRYMTYFEKN